MTMKRFLAAVLSGALVLSIWGCSNAQTPETTTEGAPDYTASQAEIDKLESLYEGRIALHGEFHNHADTGGTSDGKVDLRTWKDTMQYILDMDFAVIVDHKQVLHMRLEDWDNTWFVGGSELGTQVGFLSNQCTQNALHYNMIFSQPEQMEAVLYEFPDKFQYQNDHFKYPQFKKEEFMKIVKSIQKNGGFFSNVHPLYDSYVVSTNPEDYWYGDGMGFEVLCAYSGNMSLIHNMEARYYWEKMLNMGKRVFVTAGSDSHRLPKTESLSTFYCFEQNADEIVATARKGNFTAGPVGIRMNIGDTMMGGLGDFTNPRLVIAVSDFHSQEYHANHTYRVDVYSDSGLVASKELEGLLDPAQVSYFAMDVDPAARYYRVEIYNVTRDYIFALGNPIWNKALYTGDYFE